MTRKVEAFVGRVRHGMDTVDFEQRQKLVRLLVNQVRVTGPPAELHLRVPLEHPPSSDHAQDPQHPIEHDQNSSNQSLVLHMLSVARTRSDLDETALPDLRCRRWSAGRSVDVTEQPAVEHIVHDVLAEVGRIDVLVNCAGSFLSLAPVWETDPDYWWHDVASNLFGTFLCCRCVLPSMIADERAQQST